jgi:hypothetical protein
VRRVALLAALASCGRSAPPLEAAAGGPARAPAAEGSASAAAAPPALPGAREGDGCWGAELPAAPAARLEALGSRCAPGLRRLFDEVPLVNVAAAGEASVPLPPLPPGACLRAAAISPEGPVSLALVEGVGDEVALDAHAAFSLVPIEGPLCLGPEGRATLKLRRAGPERPAQPPGRVWVQAWASASAR